MTILKIIPSPVSHRFTVLAAGDLDQVGAIGALPSVPSVALDTTLSVPGASESSKTPQLAHNWPTTGPQLQL